MGRIPNNFSFGTLMNADNESMYDEDLSVTSVTSVSRKTFGTDCADHADEPVVIVWHACAAGLNARHRIENWEEV